MSRLETRESPTLFPQLFEESELYVQLNQPLPDRITGWVEQLTWPIAITFSLWSQDAARYNPWLVSVAQVNRARRQTHGKSVSTHQFSCPRRVLSCGEAPECACQRRLVQPALQAGPTSTAVSLGCKRTPGHRLSILHTWQQNKGTFRATNRMTGTALSRGAADSPRCTRDWICGNGPSFLSCLLLLCHLFYLWLLVGESKVHFSVFFLRQLRQVQKVCNLQRTAYYWPPSCCSCFHFCSPRLPSPWPQLPPGPDAPEAFPLLFLKITKRMNGYEIVCH